MIRLCRICSAKVMARKKYTPNFCEACQKFFRRNVEKWNKLVCESGTSNCSIEDSRRCCRKCRFEKCIKEGMRSKFLIWEDEDSTSSKIDQSEIMVETGDSEQWPQSLGNLKNPCRDLAISHSRSSTSLSSSWSSLDFDSTLFDPCLKASEQLLKAAVTAYTELLGIDKVFLIYILTFPQRNKFSF